MRHRKLDSTLAVSALIVRERTGLLLLFIYLLLIYLFTTTPSARFLAFKKKKIFGETLWNFGIWRQVTESFWYRLIHTLHQNKPSYILLKRLIFSLWSWAQYFQKRSEHPCSMPELLPIASRRRDRKRIPAESSLTFRNEPVGPGTETNFPNRALVYKEANRKELLHFTSFWRWLGTSCVSGFLDWHCVQTLWSQHNPSSWKRPLKMSEQVN